MAEQAASQSYPAAEEKKVVIRPSDKQIGMPVMAMSCALLQVLKHMCVVRLAEYLEQYCPTHRFGWNWEWPTFVKRLRMTRSYKDKLVFGVPFVVTLQRSGQALPHTIQAAMNWLSANALGEIGLFRKSGRRSRVANLKALVESSTESDSNELFRDRNPHDLADMVKQYFLDLPESLFTKKFADIFIAIFQYFPEEVRADALQSAIVLLPDENREVLYILLQLLSLVAGNSMVNQMPAYNLAVIFAPPIFHLAPTSPSVSTRSWAVTRNHITREQAKYKALHQCLDYMIQNIRSLFVVPYAKIRRGILEFTKEPSPLNYQDTAMGLQDIAFRLDKCIAAIVKEGRQSSLGWISSVSADPDVGVFYKKVDDGYPLRLWKACVKLRASPAEVCEYIINHRRLWDPLFVDGRVVKQFKDNIEVFQYVCGYQRPINYCVLRSWRTDLPEDACAVVEASVDRPGTTFFCPPVTSVRGMVLVSQFLIKPCSGGKSKIMHLARVETKGRTREWYKACFGHICSQYLVRIRNGLQLKEANNGAEGYKAIRN